MSLTYGFYNSVDHDRIYTAEQFGSIFDGVINDGVFQNIGELFAVTPNEGMQILVGTGRAWLNGTWTLNDTRYLLECSESNLIFDRIDLVVLEVDATSNVRENSLKIIEGTPSSNPVRPDVIDNEYVHQHIIAEITVKAAATEIKEEDIKNLVGTSECPFVTGILEVNNVDYLYSQWQASFETWFDHMKGQLDEDAAGHLQNEIDNLNNILTGTLSAGATTLTFTSNKITSDSYLDLYADDILISPIEVSVSSGSVTYTFNEQETAINFRLRVANMPS